MPDEVIQFYSKYHNRKSKFRISTVLGSRFEIDEKYDILDASNQSPYL